jgi:hypothetical protein
VYIRPDSDSSDAFFSSSPFGIFPNLPVFHRVSTGSEQCFPHRFSLKKQTETANFTISTIPTDITISYFLKKDYLSERSKAKKVRIIVCFFRLNIL